MVRNRILFSYGTIRVINIKGIKKKYLTYYGMTSSLIVSLFEKKKIVYWSISIF